MTWLSTLMQGAGSGRLQAGGKAVSLARLHRLGYAVPRSLVIGAAKISELLKLEE